MKIHSQTPVLKELKKREPQIFTKINHFHKE